MRGHEPLIAMRRRDLKPLEAVHVELAVWPQSRGSRLRKEAIGWFRADRVFVEPTDNPDRLDLRFLVGCDVIVHGSEADRVRRLYAALERHKARRVIANCGRVVDGVGQLDFVLDTQETLTWPA